MLSLSENSKKAGNFWEPELQYLQAINIKLNFFSIVDVDNNQIVTDYKKYIYIKKT